LSAVLFYHERMLSWTVALGPVGTIVYATAAIILRRRLRIDLDLSHRRDVVRYALVTLVAAVFSTAAGIAGLLADHSITWGQSWLSAFSWYSGDAIALVGVGPFLLIHVFPWIRRQLFDFAPEGRLTQPWKTLGEMTRSDRNGSPSHRYSVGPLGNVRFAFGEARLLLSEFSSDYLDRHAPGDWPCFGRNSFV